MITYGSVCSGIEAASVAWEPLGFQPVWFSQFDPEHNYKRGLDFPSAVLAHHWPDVPNLGDMTHIAEMVHCGFIAAPDVLVGGTPCQAFSVAGLRGGLSDGRGQLTLEFVRLANAIDEQRTEPCVIVWENVPGVLSSKDNAFGCFLAGLAGESDPLVAPGGKWANAGCVFGPQRAVAWRILDAQYFGLAQRRRRVFVVASARDGFDPTAVLFEFDGVRRDTPPSRETRQETATDAGSGVTFSCGGIRPDTADPIAATLLQSGQDLGQGCEALSVGYRMVAFGEYSDDGSASTMKARDYKDATDLAVAYAFQPRIARNGRGDMGDVVNALTATAGETGKGDAAPCVAYGFNSNAQVDQLRLNNELSETLTCSQYSAVGITAFSAKDYGGDATDDLSPTLRAGNSHTGNQNSGNWMAVQSGMTVRRLTPVECERLQGFPDGFTALPNRTADGLRYKALGNSMAVPVMRWIGTRIILHTLGAI